MKILRIRGQLLAGLLGLVLSVSLGRPEALSAGLEQTFDMLQIGTHTYRNVTVTTKSKDYVFILHSAGMTNIKVAELSPDLREQLGYAELPKPKEQPTNATAWAKQTLDKLETSRVKAVEAQVVSTWRNNVPLEKLQLPPLTPKLLWGAAAIAVCAYLFFCYCCMLICQKTGQEPGVLAWLPVFNVFPLLRAAGMSPWWFLASFVPVLNLVAYILWCVNIAKARAKTLWTAIFLLLPLTNLLAFLYLAFSGSGGRRKNENRRIEIMTLETA
ncbi:MAG TPA: DUF5684 domain-containing protein [Candidatus Acidoferrum sp.]|jgi:hypothetical protein|nr:DUF5684 domain-containing protein [Candidatus Acidoferrum sp.]